MVQLLQKVCDSSQRQSVSADADQYPLDICKTKKKTSVAEVSGRVLQEAREIARNHGMQRLVDHGHALDFILDVIGILSRPQTFVSL